jgi:hypothetical protein
MVSWAGARKMKCFSVFCGGLQTWRDTLAPNSTPCYPVQLAGKLNMFFRKVGNSSQCMNLSPFNFLLEKHSLGMLLQMSKDVIKYALLKPHPQRESASLSWSK